MNNEHITNKIKLIFREPTRIAEAAAKTTAHELFFFLILNMMKYDEIKIN